VTRPRIAQHLLHFVELALAADERRDLVRQIVRRRLHRAERGEIAPQLRMNKLIDLLGMCQITQAHVAEIAERDTGRQPVRHQCRDGVRHQYLAAVRGAHDPRAPIHRAAVEVVVTSLDNARMNAAADRQK
jgi:hypothetical protein